MLLKPFEGVFGKWSILRYLEGNKEIVTLLKLLECYTQLNASGTQKTPQKEINKAVELMNKYLKAKNKKL